MEVVGEMTEALASMVVSDGAPSARNLLVTVFGDAIGPHGEEIAVSVSSLAALVASFGANERLVRTSLSRLVADEILTVRPLGRRSFYAVDPDAIPTFRVAADEIYCDQPEEWDGRWTVVIIDGLDNTAQHRAGLRSDLIGRGLSVVAPNVLMSALVTPSHIADIVEGTEIDRLLVTRSEVVGFGNAASDRGVAWEVYPVRDWASAYQEFVDRFAPYATSGLDRLSPQEAFKLRTLIVASFRRIVVGAVRLPPELLPDPWVGDTARELVAELYGRLIVGSESFLAATVETIDGRWPPLSAPLEDRFRFVAHGADQTASNNTAPS